MASNDVLGLIPAPRYTECFDNFISVKNDFNKIEGIVKKTIVSNYQMSNLHISSTDNERINSESYVLDISSEGITIIALNKVGVFYGVQTLKQLFMTAVKDSINVNNILLPYVHIEDIPAFEWRGVMIDTSRTFYPISFLMKIIDSLALHKLNRFHWHLTDDQGWRLPVKEYPKLTEIGGYKVDHRYCDKRLVGGFYTEEEIKAFVSYAAERNIIVVPEIETPGHASAVLAAYPELGCSGGPYNVEDRFGIFEDVLCSGSPDVFSFFGKVFDTVCELFPAPYVHIGGDECPRDSWKKCPKCQALMKKEGLKSEDEIQSWFTVKFAKMLEERGKIAIGWDEVLDGTERLGLPKSLIVQSWRGKESGVKASELGHNVVMSPNTDGCYLDYKNYDTSIEPGNLGITTVKNSYDYSPIPSSLPKEAEKNILGGQCNLWTEYIYAGKIAEYMLFPRLCAISESLWIAQKEKDFNSFSTRLVTHKKRLEKLDLEYYKGPLE